MPSQMQYHKLRDTVILPVEQYRAMVEKRDALAEKTMKLCVITKTILVTNGTSHPLSKNAYERLRDATEAALAMLDDDK